MPWTCVKEHFSSVYLLLSRRVHQGINVFLEGQNNFTFWSPKSVNAIPSSNLQSSDFFTRLICSLEVGKPLSLKSCKHKGHRLERLLKVSSFCGKFHRYDIRYSSRVGREFDSGTSNANSIVMWFHLFNSSLDIVCTKNVFTCSTDWSWLFWRRANLDRLQVSEFSDSIL